MTETDDQTQQGGSDDEAIIAHLDTLRGNEWYDAVASLEEPVRERIRQIYMARGSDLLPPDGGEYEAGEYEEDETDGSEFALDVEAGNYVFRVGEDRNAYIYRNAADDPTAWIASFLASGSEPGDYGDIEFDGREWSALQLAGNSYADAQAAAADDDTGKGKERAPWIDDDVPPPPNDDFGTPPDVDVADFPPPPPPPEYDEAQDGQSEDVDRPLPPDPEPDEQVDVQQDPFAPWRQKLNVAFPGFENDVWARNREVFADLVAADGNSAEFMATDRFLLLGPKMTHAAYLEYVAVKGRVTFTRHRTRANELTFVVEQHPNPPAGFPGHDELGTVGASLHRQTEARMQIMLNDKNLYKHGDRGKITFNWR